MIHRTALSSLRRPRMVLAPLVALTALALGRDARADLPPGCAGLGEALTEHSCFHAQYGPSQAVLATPGATPAPDTPGVDAVHTEYRVGLPAPGGPNVVTYTPKRSGSWAIFLDAAVPLTVLDEAGATLPVLLAEDGTTGCDALPVARVFSLEEGTTYPLVLGPSDRADVLVVLEHIDDFIRANGRDADGDGWGSPDDVVMTSCAPPAGYVGNALDCDDANPATNPAAAEFCDGVDQNCNGAPDDVGLECRAGEGACQRVGEWLCAAPGGLAACSATPGLPAAEQCNNVDDDCDGAVDQGGPLCADPDAPACVREGMEAACGCLFDLDCGPPDSGRVCDPAAKRCLDGCSTAPGGNGCPAGQACVAGACEGAGGGGAEPGGSTGAQRVGGCACSIPSRAGARGDRAGLLAALAGALLLSLRRRRASLARARLAALLVPLLLGALGCGTTVVEAPGAAGGDCIPALAAAPVEHACSHGLHGPFESVIASPDPAGAPPVDGTHIPYRVELDADGAARGWVRYTPSREGEHVLFTDPAAPLDVEDAAGAPLDSVEVDWPELCDTFAAARLVRLAAGQSYRLALGPAAASPVLLYVEHLGTFGDEAWSRRCD